MSRRAVAQPRKSSSPSGLTGECPRSHAGPAEFGKVKHPKIHTVPRMKRWNLGFYPTDISTLNPSQTAAPEAGDSESPGYKNISEIKNRIRSSAYRTAAGFNLSTGLNPRVKARPDKSFQLGNESNTTTADSGVRPDFINPDIKPPARISDIPESVISTSETDNPMPGKIKPLLNASALLAHVAADGEAPDADLETAPNESPIFISPEKEEAPIPVKSFAEISPQTIKPLKRALKLIRPPEVKEDENEERIKSESPDAVAAISEDEAVQESEEINAATGSDDNIQKHDINARPKIEFVKPDNEAAETGAGSDNDVAAAEITPELAEPIPVATDVAKPVSTEENVEEASPQIKLELKRVGRVPVRK